MTKYIKIFSLLVLLAFSIKTIAQDLPQKPNPPRLVNDYTNTLTADQQQALENKLVAFDDSTSTQVAVVIVPSLDGDEVNDYAVKLGRSWGIGGKEFNNGVLLLIARNDRKLGIATGYGVEGALPDVTAKHIIDEVIVPNFKGDDYYRGIDEGTDAIIKAVQGEYHVQRSGRNAGVGIAKFIFIIIMIIVFLIAAGRGGGRNGGFMSRRGYRNILGPMIINSLLNSGRGGGGGGWSGGGSSGSGGGFGGFGGGSFGGGGASGSW